MKKLAGLMVLMVVLVACQKTVWDTPKYQKITLAAGDSVVTFRIADTEGVEVEGSNGYWWYKGNEIFVTRGGFAGKLLDGEYLVQEGNGTLRTKGQFDKGLKTGLWAEWAQGSLLSQAEFKEGVRDGAYKEFLSGNLILEGQYDKGYREGEFVRYMPDTTLTVNYKNGEIVIPVKTVKESSEK